MGQEYPDWIDAYTKSMHQAFSNMLPCSWGPVDVMEIMEQLNGVYVSRLYEAVKEVKKKGVSLEQVARSFSTLSAFRISLWYVLGDYINAGVKDKEEMRVVLDTLVGALKTWAKEDLFALAKNIGHSSEEIEEITQGTRWQDGSPEVARELGKLYNSVASLAFGLYRDFFPQEAHEVYGPYDVSGQYGDGAILIIKHFPKIRPVELWPQAKDFKHREVKIYQVFRGVKFRCEAIGMHSIYEGDLMNGLGSYAVEVAGREVSGLAEIKELREYFEQLAIKQAVVYDDMTHEQLVGKSLEWLCYQYVGLFELAGMDWRPTEEMRRVVDPKKVSSRHEEDEFPSYNEFVKSKDYEVYWLKSLYA